MNSLRHMNFQDIASTICPQGPLRKQLISYALGVVAASNAPLPLQALACGPADPVRQHYASVVEPQVLEIIDSFNEQIVVDLTLAQEVALAYWVARYEALHPLRMPILKQGVGSSFESRYFHLARTLSENTQSLGLNNPDEISELVNHVHLLLNLQG